MLFGCDYNHLLLKNLMSYLSLKMTAWCNFRCSKYIRSHKYKRYISRHRQYPSHRSNRYQCRCIYKFQSKSKPRLSRYKVRRRCRRCIFRRRPCPTLRHSPRRCRCIYMQGHMAGCKTKCCQRGI